MAFKRLRLPPGSAARAQRSATSRHVCVNKKIFSWGNRRPLSYWGCGCYGGRSLVHSLCLVFFMGRKQRNGASKPPQHANKICAGKQKMLIGLLLTGVSMSTILMFELEGMFALRAPSIQLNVPAIYHNALPPNITPSSGPGTLSTSTLYGCWQSNNFPFFRPINGTITCTLPL